MFLEVEIQTFFHSVAPVGNRCLFERCVGMPEAEKRQIMDVKLIVLDSGPCSC